LDIYLLNHLITGKLPASDHSTTQVQELEERENQKRVNSLPSSVGKDKIKCSVSAKCHAQCQI